MAVLPSSDDLAPDEEHPAIQQLVELGKQKSFVTYDDILRFFPEAERDIDQLDEAHAALLAMGKKLLLLTDTGELVLFAANPKEFKELGRAQVCGANWCNPAYADGKLFLRDTRELVCVELLP